MRSILVGLFCFLRGRVPDQATNFQLFDIDSDFAYEFPIFPEQIRTSGRANWEPQETTSGTKPLFYGNTDPLVINIDEAVIDYAIENVSAASDVDLLRMMHSEPEQGGPPPALVAMWGDRKIRCVMTNLHIREEMFNSRGNPTRLRVTMELTELQPDGEATDVQVGIYNEDVEPG